MLQTSKVDKKNKIESISLKVVGNQQVLLFYLFILIDFKYHVVFNKKDPKLQKLNLLNGEICELGASQNLHLTSDKVKLL